MRITNVWNSLPFSVITAPLVNSFKNRLDKHWASQGTRSGSRVEFFEFTIISLPLYTK